jgi:DNA-binding transcriptional LysR family regulator
LSTLNLLNSFHAVASTGSISSAAKSLGMSQPALSRQLRTLSEHLGIDLFIRRQRGVELTLQGRQLRDAIGPSILGLQERLELVRVQSKEPKGKIRIGSLTEFGKSFVVPRITTFIQNYPDAEVELRFETGLSILASLQNRSLDFGIVATKPKSGSLLVQKFADERSVLVTRSGNFADINSVGAMATAKFVSYRMEDPLLHQFVKVMVGDDRSMKVNPHVAINDHGSMVRALLAADYYAVMPIHSVESHLAAGALRVASSIDLKSPVWLVRPDEKRPSMLKNAFMQAISKI